MRNPATRVLATALLLAGAAGCTGAAQTTPAAPPRATPAAPVAVTSPEAEPLDEDPPTGKDGYLLSMAITQMDEGEFSNAIRTLEALRRKHPNNGIILHELGLAYRIVKRPADAVNLWMPYRARLSVTTLAGLASALDEAGRAKEAITLLREEIPKHPTSGLLHSELATTLVNAGKRDEALGLYEKSTEVDPGFAPSYMHLATLYASTRSRGLTLLHGETFRILEPKTARSERIAKLMVQVCDDAVEVTKTATGGTSAHVSLAPDVVIARPEDAANLPIVNLFELTFAGPLTAAHMQGLSLASLHGARRAFVDNLKGKKAPARLAATPLMQWLRALDTAGHLEAYDYWLFGPADPQTQGQWFAAHTAPLEAMIKYLVTHPLYPKEQEPGQTPSNVTAHLDAEHLHELQPIMGGRDRRLPTTGAERTRLRALASADDRSPGAVAARDPR